MKALMGFEPVHNGKRWIFCWLANLPTELSYPCWQQIVFKTTHDFLICQPNVFISMFKKQANVNIVIRSWQYSNSI